MGNQEPARCDHGTVLILPCLDDQTSDRGRTEIKSCTSAESKSRKQDMTGCHCTTVGNIVKRP